MKSFIVMLALALTAASVHAAAAIREIRTSPEPVLAGAVADIDTFWFGGTYWNAGASRWEASVGLSRDNAWTFDSGVDGNKEGWTARDLDEFPAPLIPPGNPDDAHFRWTNDLLWMLYGEPGTDLFPPATPADDGAIWCGMYPIEEEDFCCQSPEPSWRHAARKTFAYGGTGDVRLTFRYFNDTEKGFDFTHLYLMFDGVEEAAPRVTMTLTLGSPVSKRTKTLTVTAASIPEGTSQITPVFRFVSDGGWSGCVGFPRTYGHFACYNFTYEDLAAPNNNDEDTFESGPDGWTFQQPPVATYSDVTSLAELPEAPGCSGLVLQGNVLTFHDRSAAPGEPFHPDDQDEMAVSPYIDLAGNGLSTAPTRLMVCDYFADLPLENAVYYKAHLRAYPVLCEATGAYVEADLAPDPYIHATEGPACANEAILEDFSPIAQPIEYCRAEIEVLALCSHSTACTNPIGNTTPWFDNIRFAVSEAPAVVGAGEPSPPSGRLLVGPNPARGEASLTFELSTAGPARLEVFDVSGARVRTLAEGWLAAGTHRASWDGTGGEGRVQPSGVYWVRCRTNNEVISKALVLLR